MRPLPWHVFCCLLLSVVVCCWCYWLLHVTTGGEEVHLPWCNRAQHALLGMEEAVLHMCHQTCGTCMGMLLVCFFLLGKSLHAYGYDISWCFGLAWLPHCLPSLASCRLFQFRVRCQLSTQAAARWRGWGGGCCSPWREARAVAAAGDCSGPVAYWRWLCDEAGMCNASMCNASMCNASMCNASTRMLRPAPSAAASCVRVRVRVCSARG